MFLKKMRLLSFIKEKVKKKKVKTKVNDDSLTDKKIWLKGEGPQTD